MPVAARHIHVRSRSADRRGSGVAGALADMASFYPRANGTTNPVNCFLHSLCINPCLDPVPSFHETRFCPVPQCAADALTNHRFLCRAPRSGRAGWPLRHRQSVCKCRFTVSARFETARADRRLQSRSPSRKCSGLFGCCSAPRCARDSGRRSACTRSRRRSLRISTRKLPEIGSRCARACKARTNDTAASKSAR